MTLTPTFVANFETLSLSDGQSGSGTWLPGYWWAPDGNSEPGTWLVNPEWGPTSAADADPYSVNNGTLSISVLDTPPNVLSSVGGAPYLSGQLTTFGSFEQEYGYFQVTAKMSDAAGVDNAIWLLPADGAWPPELDIAEVLGQYPDDLITTVHSDATGTPTQQSQDTTVNNTTDSFNTYAVDWEPNTITWYFNGNEVFQEPTPADMHTPMYLLLDVGAGNASSWQGAPTSASEFPSSMEVSSVEVWASDPYTSTSTSSSTPPATPPVLTGTSGGTLTATVNGTTINAGSGSETFILNSTGDTVNAGTGTDTITDNDGGNTIVLPQAGHGTDQIYGSVLDDTLSLANLLAGTSWNGETSTLGNYLKVKTSGNGNSVLSVEDRGRGSAVTVATLHGAGISSLSGLLAHATT